ncbi:hypothetical protein ACFLVO_03145 [Chloroflexota bacterium]
MEQLHFTTKVLGPLSAYRLKEKQVTQTIRSSGSSIVHALLSTKSKIGERLEVKLDGRPIGLAEYISMDVVNWEYLNLDDSRRCGFDIVDSLHQALMRAGYSPRPLYRLLFFWLKEHTESNKDKIIELLCQSDATYVEIGKHVGTSRQRVFQIAKKAGLTRNRRLRHYRSDVTTEVVLKLYHSNLLIKDIARTLGCNQATVRKRLMEAGISSSEKYSRGAKLRGGLKRS